MSDLLATRGRPRLSPEGSVQLHVRVPAGLCEQIAQYADTTSSSKSEVVRDAVEAFFAGSDAASQRWEKMLPPIDPVILADIFNDAATAMGAVINWRYYQADNDDERNFWQDALTRLAEETRSAAASGVEAQLAAIQQWKTRTAELQAGEIDQPVLLAA